MQDLTQNQLRAIAGVVLFLLAIFYIYSKAENENLEFIMMGLTGSLIGFSILPNKSKE